MSVCLRPTGRLSHSRETSVPEVAVGPPDDTKTYLNVTDGRTDRQTDRQTTYCGITSLCVIA